jgi:hypothetical protein
MDPVTSAKVAKTLLKNKKVRAFVVGFPMAVIALLIAFLIFMATAIDAVAEESEDPYAKQCASAGVQTGITFGGQMDIILTTIRTTEHISVKNSVKAGKLVGFEAALAKARDLKIYSAQPTPGNGSTASGAYQFLDGTWKSHQPAGSNYARAYLAPPEIQDMAAKKMVENILVKTSIDNVGPSWLYGSVPKGAAWDAKQGVNPSPREYQSVWMKVYNQIVAIAYSGNGEPATQNQAVASPSTSPSVSPSVSPSTETSTSVSPAPVAPTGVSFKDKARPEDVVQIGDSYKGNASTYGNDPITGYIDTGDNNKPAFAGASNDQLGIAIYNQGTLGGWWYVAAPNGRSAILKQTDYGPSTERMIDINAVAARSAFGYPAATFPTDQGQWIARYLGKTQPPEAVYFDTKGTGDTPTIATPPAVDIPLSCNASDVGNADYEGDSPGTQNLYPAYVPGGPVGSDQITNVQGIRVNVSIAANTDRMLSAMKAYGLNPSGGGYRDPAGQLAVRRSNCGSSNYAIYEMPSSQCSPPTAKPGSSMHEKGLAIDFTCNGNSLNRSSPCFAWLQIHAAEYGFKNFPKEAWHWSVNGR